MGTVHYQFAQLKQINKRLQAIGDRMVSNGHVPEQLNTAYDTLQDRLGSVYKTVNDLSVTKSIPGMVYIRLDTEISQLSTDITSFGTKVNNYSRKAKVNTMKTTAQKKAARAKREAQIRRRLTMIGVVVGIGIGVGACTAGPKIKAALPEKHDGCYVADYMDANGVLHDTDGDGDMYHWECQTCKAKGIVHTED